jgi:hypothetical protein
MTTIEIRKDSIDNDGIDVSAFSMFIDGEEELFITPMHVKEDKEHYEKIMKFISDACQYVLESSKINNDNPFELANYLNRQVKV